MSVVSFGFVFSHGLPASYFDFLFPLSDVSFWSDVYHVILSWRDFHSYWDIRTDDSSIFLFFPIPKKYVGEDKTW